MNVITDIFSKLAGVAGGGWGAVGAIVALLVGVFLLYRWYISWKREKAAEDTKKQGAKDQAGSVAGNQASEAQAAEDEAAAQKKLNPGPGRADTARSDVEPRP